MGTVLRMFVIDRDGNPRRLANASFGALVEGAVPVPEWAAWPFLCADVAVWCENRRPVRILGAVYHRYAVDARGRIAQSVQESARLGLEIMGSRVMRPPPGAPRGRERFLERQRDAFFWTPTPEQERAIRRMIYRRRSRPPTAPGPRVIHRRPRR
jgi:hypothetical protein